MQDNRSFQNRKTNSSIAEEVESKKVQKKTQYNYNVDYMSKDEINKIIRKYTESRPNKGRLERNKITCD